jgi:hypothetical protein
MWVCSGARLNLMTHGRLARFIPGAPFMRLRMSGDVPPPSLSGWQLYNSGAAVYRYTNGKFVDITKTLKSTQ